MCLIIFKPAGSPLSVELTKQGVLDNRDGWGIMQSIEGRLVIDKGLEPDSYLNAASLIPVERAAVLHTRIKTKGAATLPNCHPFQINKDMAMMHNGSIQVDITNPEMSDTWHFAHRVVGPMLTRRPELFGDPRFVRLIEKSIGIGNKLVFMRSDGIVMIVNRKEGAEKDGMWISNTRSNFGTAWNNKDSKDWTYTAPARDGDYFSYGFQSRGVGRQNPYYNAVTGLFEYPEHEENSYEEARNLATTSI